MQLRLRRSSSHVLLALSMSALFAAPSAFADVGTFETTHTLYHEAPLRSNMTVYSPSVDATVSPTSAVEIKGGWEADIVSGASVAVKAGSAYQATNPGVDVITTASVKDVRNVGRGGVRLSQNTTQLALNYSYSTENDYKSHSFDVAKSGCPPQPTDAPARRRQGD